MTITVANSVAADSAIVADAPPEPSLMARALRGSAWTTFGYVFSQSFRFASNLILAHLLAQKSEVFGVMATVTIVMMGLQMFSDVGLDKAIIQMRRGAEPAYQNTAWTIQVCRGIILWLAACALAWPVSLLWGAQLRVILPVAGLTAVFAGFQSTSLYALQRKIRLGALTRLNIGADMVAKGVIITYALFSPTVWALVVGSLVGSAITAAASHWLDPELRNRLTWDKTAAGEIYRFGRWITFSTIITFVAANLEKLAFAPLFGNKQFGVFWIAVMLADLGPALMKRLAGRVGFPALADLHRRDVDRFHYRLAHARLALILPTHIGVFLVVVLGGWFVTVAYPQQYAAASWILPILAVNSLAGVLNTTYGSAYLALGKTFPIMIVVAGQVLAIAVTTVVGYTLAGQRGFIFAFACVQWLLYPLYAVLSIRLGIWQPRIDLPALTVSGVIALGLLLT